MLVQERLKELFYYSPHTGLFTRRVRTSNNTKIGVIAGHKNSDGYIMLGVDNVAYSAHRLAFLYMLGRFPKEHTDHIDHIRWNNKWNNLREVTHAENCRNQKLSSLNLSKASGVCWDNTLCKWRAQISFDNERIYLGMYFDINAAILTRKVAEFAYGFHRNHGR